MKSGLEKIFAICAIVGALFVPATAGAQLLTSEEMIAMEERLNLTPEQRRAIEPILQTSMVARKSTFQKYGIDLQTCERPGVLSLVRLNKDMNKINSDTRTRLSKVLNPEQLREYDKIVAEKTASVKKQIMC